MTKHFLIIVRDCNVALAIFGCVHFCLCECRERRVEGFHDKKKKLWKPINMTSMKMI